MNIDELEQEFNQVNLLKEKNSMDRLKFCWKLIESDENDYLEAHLMFLDKANKYLAKDLEEQFQFRKDREKVFYFLEEKLKQDISPKLHQQIIGITNELDFKSLEQYKNWLQEIKSGKRDDEMDFVWSIMKSPYVEYHYNLITDKTLNNEFRRDLSSRFKEHQDKAEDFLINKLDQNQDYEFQGDIIFQLGKLNKKHKAKILNYTREFTESELAYTRNKALIVLGWIGKIADTKILEKHMLEDPDTECRAWSASAYMQLWFKRKNETLKKKAFEGYFKALPLEKDYFVLSVILDSIREIGKTKLGISQTALDDLDVEKIEISKIKAMNYLEKQLK